jgi:hypothetical protein
MTKVDDGQQHSNQPTTGVARAGGSGGGNGNSDSSNNDGNNGGGCGGKDSSGNSRGSGQKNVIFSNGPKIVFEWSSLLY